jgi:hypothetical protein
VLLAAMAVGRFSVISVRDARRAERAAEREAEPETAEPASHSRRFGLRRKVTTTDETDETDEPATEPATASRS